MLDLVSYRTTTGNQHQLGNYNAYVLIFVRLHFALPDTRVHNSFEELYITQAVDINSFAKMLNSLDWGAYIL